MSYFNFLQAGGFPMDLNVLAKMQSDYQIYDKLGHLAGDLTIIEGCQLSGSTVTAGTVFISGEVLPFMAGDIMDTVVIINEPVFAEFENGTSNVIRFERYAAFGSGVTTYNWLDFKRAFPTKDIPAALDLKEDKTTVQLLAARILELEKKTAPFASGKTYLLWNRPANEIPPGWIEAEEMRGLFPVGQKPGDSDFSTIGNAGGAKTKTLSVSEMPPHKHNVPFAYAGNVVPNGGSGQHIVNGTSQTTEVGGGQAFSILNPFRIVMFIKYVG